MGRTFDDFGGFLRIIGCPWGAHLASFSAKNGIRSRIQKKVEKSWHGGGQAQPQVRMTRTCQPRDSSRPAQASLARRILAGKPVHHRASFIRPMDRPTLRTG